MTCVVAKQPHCLFSESSATKRSDFIKDFKDLHLKPVKSNPSMPLHAQFSYRNTARKFSGPSFLKSLGFKNLKNEVSAPNSQ